MPQAEPGKIRNVGVVGHRGTGKTSLVEAMLFQGGATNRLGTIEQGTTISDFEEDEQRRSMSIAASLCHLEWQDRKINLIDTPGEPSFQGDAIAGLMVVEGALFVVNGVMGVEVQTGRLWERADALGLARVLFVNMLDRERADFFRTLDAITAQLSSKAVAVHLPIGVEHELSGIVDLLHMTAYTSPEGEREGSPGEIPADMADQVAEYREKLLDSVVETDEALMERYLEGEELSTEEVAHALKDAVTRGEVFPVACGVATKNLGTTAVLDLLIEAVPSPAKKPLDLGVDADGAAAFVFKTIADPFAGRINVFRVLAGDLASDSNVVNVRNHGKERVGQLLVLQGKDDEQTGEQLLAGMSQMHVEVAIDRIKRRFGVDIELHQPRVPYLESIRKESRAQGRYKKQTGGRGDFGDCHRVLGPIPGHEGYEFVDRIVGGVIPQGFRPAVDKGIQEAMHHGELAGAPVQGVRVELVDGSYHTVDSSEMAFKIAGSMAWKDAYLAADPVLLEPIMELEATVPDDAVGAVNGDLNSRRGRLQGMEPLGGFTTIRAEVPMSELLTYAQSLTSMTGGRGDYSMHFLRYEEVPPHVAQKVIDETKREREAAAAH